MGKIVSKEEYSKLKDNFAEKKVILCHGVFDLLHAGHVDYFREAKSLGDILVVSVTAEKYVRKGIGRPYFNDEVRCFFLAAIKYIDYVILAEEYTAKGIIELVEPDLYVKGKEYEDASSDLTGKIGEEIKLVREHGGDIYFTSGIVFSSTNLINRCFNSFSDDIKTYMKNLCKKTNINDIVDMVDKISDKKILLVGDTYFDKYHFCNALDGEGYSHHNIIEEKRVVRYSRGVWDVAEIIAEFADDVTILTLLNDKYADTLPKKDNVIDMSEYSENYINLEYDNFVEKKYGLINKLYSVISKKNKKEINDSMRTNVVDKIKREANKYDCVLVFDYGLGMIDDELISEIEKCSKCLFVTSRELNGIEQINNIMRFRHSDYFAVTKKEIQNKLLLQNKSDKEALQEIEYKLKGKGWILDAGGESCMIQDNEFIQCPSLFNSVKDINGSDEAFSAMALLISLVGGSVEISALMGNIARTLKAQLIGNSTKLEKVNILSYARTLLNWSEA